MANAAAAHRGSARLRCESLVDEDKMPVETLQDSYSGDLDKPDSRTISSKN